jgi:sarcosine oxidase
MTERSEFIVVGAGLLGLAAARALASRGREVAVLEQAEIGHPAGGSHGSCRIFRLGYRDPGYVSMASRARELWRDLETERGLRLLHPAPQLTFGAGLDAVQAAMTAAGAPCELLPAATAAARFPALATAGPALLEPDSCVIAADNALRALAAAAPVISTGVRVTAVADDGRRVTVSTEAGSFAARVVIVCAGPWTSGLLRPAGLAAPASATLERVAYLEAGGHGPVPDLPIFIRHGVRSPYGLPVPRSSLYKIGIHPGGPPVDPDGQDHGPDDEQAGRLDRLARRYLPGLDPRPVRIESCIYDNTPDEDFIMDRAGQIVIGCGTSGHGFKFGPLLGEWLADLAAGTPPAAPWPTFAARFAMRRFR